MKRIFTLAALVFAVSSFGQEACPAPIDVNSNGAVDIADFLNVLGLFGDVDSDGDGVWDSQDGCIDVEACNYSSPLAGICIYQDALGDCNGNCPADADGDGICDTHSCGDSISYQGYEYATVQIGEQCWFAENLRNEYYSNGDSIPTQEGNLLWSQSSVGLRSVWGEGESGYVNGDPNEDYNLQIRGRLYNGYAVLDERNLCPLGWSVPEDTDWIKLEIFLGMDSVIAHTFGYRGNDEGYRLKSDDSDYWNWQGSDEVGFDALNGGHRSSSGTFHDSFHKAFFWTKTLLSSGHAYHRRLKAWEDMINRGSSPLNEGFSVRCIQDPE